jgi:hypothetical protein
MWFIELIEQLKQVSAWIGVNPARWVIALLVLTASSVWMLRGVAQTIYQRATTSRTRERHHARLLAFFDVLAQTSLFEIYRRVTQRWVINVDLRSGSPVSLNPWSWSSESFALCVLIATHYVFALVIFADWSEAQTLYKTRFSDDITAPILNFLGLIVAGSYLYAWDRAFYLSHAGKWTRSKIVASVGLLFLTYLLTLAFTIENCAQVFWTIGPGLILLLLLRGKPLAVIVFFLWVTFSALSDFYVVYWHGPLDPQNSYVDYSIATKQPFKKSLLYYLFFVSYYDWLAMNVGRYFLAKAAVGHTWLDVLKSSLFAVLTTFVLCSITVIIAYNVTGKPPAVLLEYAQYLKSNKIDDLFQDADAAKALSVYVMSITVLLPLLAFCLLVLLGFAAKLSGPVVRSIAAWMHELLSQEGEQGLSMAGLLIQVLVSGLLILVLFIVMLT